MKVRYNRQVNKRILYLGCFVFTDFAWLLVGFAILTATTRLHIGAIFAICYLVYGFVFRLGRAPGYPTHVVQKVFLNPRHRRPGHVSPPFPFDVTLLDNPPKNETL